MAFGAASTESSTFAGVSGCESRDPRVLIGERFLGVCALGRGAAAGVAAGTAFLSSCRARRSDVGSRFSRMVDEDGGVPPLLLPSLTWRRRRPLKRCGTRFGTRLAAMTSARFGLLFKLFQPGDREVGSTSERGPLAPPHA